ncbi:MAG: lysylphosphatidylglycerol synthase transmembrane domain-containing protein [Candidatus Thorarchaeota archaeon]
MNRNLLGKHLIRLIGLILFVVIILGTDFTNAEELVLNIDVISFLFLTFLVLPIMAFKGLRWYVIARGLKINLKATDAVEGLCIAQMTGFSLPGSLGDLIRVPFLKCRGNPSDRSILSLFIDAIAAAIIPYSVALIALIEFFNLDVILIVAGFVFGVLLLGGGYALYRLVKIVLRPWVLQARLRRIQKGGAVGRYVLNLRESIRIIGFPTFLIAALVSGIAWFLYSVQGWLLAQVLMLDISWYHVALALTLTSMITVLPISIQGVGVREGMLLLIFSTLLGFESSSVVIFSIILTMISLTPSLFGFVSWMRDPFVKLEPASVEDAITQPIELFLNLPAFDRENDSSSLG